jgi:hypothetical protein
MAEVPAFPVFTVERYEADQLLNDKTFKSTLWSWISPLGHSTTLFIQRLCCILMASGGKTIATNATPQHSANQTAVKIGRTLTGKGWGHVVFHAFIMLCMGGKFIVSDFSRWFTQPCRLLEGRAAPRV